MEKLETSDQSNEKLTACIFLNIKNIKKKIPTENLEEQLDSFRQKKFSFSIMCTL